MAQHTVLVTPQSSKDMPPGFASQKITIFSERQEQVHHSLIWGKTANLGFTFDSWLWLFNECMFMPGNIANVKHYYLYDTVSPSEQHMQKLLIIHKYLLDSNVEYF